MLTISRRAGARSGWSRRRFLQASLLAPLGLSHTALAQSAASVSPSFGRAKRCIVVFLNGGPSQLDLWDMKPDAPLEIRGELRPIATNVPGIQVSELLPQTARLADKYKIVRTVTHDASMHTTGMVTMLTGSYHRTPKVDQTRITPQDHPHLGATFSRFRGWSGGRPPFVTLPMLFRAPPVEGVWPGLTAGFLGPRYDPLVIDGDKQHASFRFPEVELPADITASRLQDRRELLGRLDDLRRCARATAWWQTRTPFFSRPGRCLAPRLCARPSICRASRCPPESVTDSTCSDKDCYSPDAWSKRACRW